MDVLRLRELVVGAALILVAVAALPRDAEAVAQRQWTGFGTAPLVFSDPNNWNGHTAIEAGDLLEFPYNSVDGEIQNDLAGLHIERLTFSAREHVLTGNAIDVNDIVVSGGGPTIALSITGVGRTTVNEFGDLTLSGTNTFTGKIDVYGDLIAASNSALGSIAGPTEIHAGGTLSFEGRDLGNEHIVVDPPATVLATCALENSGGTSYLRYLLVSGQACIINGGTINYPASINEYFGPYEVFLIGGTHIVSGPTAATGVIHIAGPVSMPTNLIWNSTGAVAISTMPLGGFTGPANLSGTGTVASVDFYGGTIMGGTENAPGTFTSTGPFNLHDATFNATLNSTAAGTGYSQVKAGGPVTIGAQTSLSVALGFTPGSSQSFRILDNTGTQAISGTFKGLPDGATFALGGKTWTITYKGGTGNDVVISTAAPSPPPPTDPRPFKRVVPMVAKTP
ncbi:MAG: hypothetical protein AB7J35_13375 [Dehalococcoidia bacterium]